MSGALAVLQARMSSTRLPGKVLMDIGSGETMLALMLKRLERAKSLERIVVATSDDPSDDAIAAASKGSVPLYRGPLHDVLARYAGAIGDHDGVVVRVTADCPLIDPEVVDGVVALMQDPRIAYASNVDPRSYPKGLDTEAFRPEALRELAAETTDPAEREHVTLGLRARPERWPAASLVRDGEDLSELRWTVDTGDDLEHVREIVRRLGDRRYEAGLDEILAVTPSPT